MPILAKKMIIIMPKKVTAKKSDGAERDSPEK